MIGHARPVPPADFPDEAIQTAKRKWETQHEDWLKAGCPKPKTQHIETPDAHWKSYRGAFYQAQKRKCGFCEHAVGNQIAPIDHFAPKGEVNSLVPGAQGTEAGDGGVSGREEQRQFSYGYWGQAFDWDNWLLVCERCNTGWKRSFFAVAETPMPEPKPGIPYTPLLLSPFFDDPAADPERHLEFTPVGGIVPRGLPDGTLSLRGRTTIDLLGLDRTSLEDVRAQVAQETDLWCDRYLVAFGQGNLVRMAEVAADLRLHAQADFPFAGVVRSRIRQNLPIEWTEL